MCDHFIADALLFIVRITGILNELIAVHHGWCLQLRQPALQNSHGMPKLLMALHLHRQ
jgi:hypothetical protein